MTRFVAMPLESPGADAAGLKNPLQDDRRIRALLFDLDGTLYRQTPMRALMAMELLTLAVSRPFSAPRQLRALKEYRRAQEALRTGPASHARQLEVAVERSGVPAEELSALVNEWMLERPLKYLPLCRATGLGGLLDLLDRKALPLALFSDYPADGKLRALGLEARFRIVLCSTDPDIAAFKPNPRGFEVACARLGLPPSEVLMVGDRADVDGEGARAAGMPCVIIGRAPSSTLNQAGILFLPSLERLRCVLDDDDR